MGLLSMTLWRKTAPRTSKERHITVGVNNQNSMVWATPGDGIIRPTEKPNQYTNESFVSLVHEDNTALGYMMSSRFPTPTTITLMSGIPSSWVRYNTLSSDEELIESSINFLLPSTSIGEIDGSERLWVPKRKQSQRLRHIAPFAHMKVSPQGIQSKGTPESIIKLLSSVVAGVYMIVEKSTVSSITKKLNFSISTSRKTKMNTAYDIVSRRNRVAESCLIASYAEPSTTTALRLFYLYEVLGVERTHRLCDRVYYSLYEDQLFSIEEIMSTISQQ